MPVPDNQAKKRKVSERNSVQTPEKVRDEQNGEIHKLNVSYIEATEAYVNPSIPCSNRFSVLDDDLTFYPTNETENELNSTASNKSLNLAPIEKSFIDYSDKEYDGDYRICVECGQDQHECFSCGKFMMKKKA